MEKKNKAEEQPQEEVKAEAVPVPQNKMLTYPQGCVEPIEVRLVREAYEALLKKLREKEEKKAK